MADDTRESPHEGEVLNGVAAIAAFIGMPENPCRHRVDKGDIPTFKIGAIRCARRSTLNAWLAEREPEGGKADRTNN